MRVHVCGRELRIRSPKLLLTIWSDHIELSTGFTVLVEYCSTTIARGGNSTSCRKKSRTPQLSLDSA